MSLRRVLIGIAIAIVVVIIALFVAVSLVNINKFRPQIQAELQSKLNRPVTLGEMHLHIFPLSISVDGLTIGEPGGFAANPPFVRAQEVSASASLTSLFGGKPDIRDLTLKEPQVELIQNAQGIWNFANIGQPPEAAPAPGYAPGPPRSAPANKPGAAPQHGSAPQFTLSQLKIVDGQVAVTDEKTKSPRQVYNHIDITLANFAPEKQFSLAAYVHFPGPGKELLSFNGTGGPLARNAGETTPLNGRLMLQQISLAGLNSVAAGAIPPNTNAEVSGAATLRTENQTVSCTGNLTLTKPVVNGKPVGYPIDAQYDVALHETNDQIDIHTGVITIGPTTLKTSGVVNAGATPMTADLRLGTQNASIQNLMELASAFGAGSSGEQIKGTVSADFTASGSVKNPRVQGNIVAPNVVAQGIALSNVHAALKMENGVLQLAPVTAGVFGGAENGTITLDTKPAQPLCSVNSKLSGVDVNALLSAVSSVQNVIDGSLAADTNVNFALGASNNLASTIDGTVNFDVSNGHLKNVNILGEISKIEKFLNAGAVSSANQTILRRLSGTFDIAHGLANTNNLVAVLDQGSLSGKGSLNLVNESLDMHLNVVLSSGLSKAVGGTGIGGFLNTALANNQGELVLPVIVTGSMAHPVFAPDVQAIAQMKINHLVPTANNPGGVLGTLLGAAGQKAGQKSQPSGQNPLNSLFNALGKKH
jgi:AsmA protein